MSVLSFSSGRPIAKIEGGELNEEILHIKEDNEDNSESYSDETCSDCEEECCDYCHPKKCIRKPCCRGCGIYRGSGKKIKKQELDAGTKFDLPNGKLMFVPNIDTRETIYIAGPGGSGKSTLASKYLEMYKKLFPKNPIIIFSNKDKDEVLDRLKPLRYIIDESIITDPPDLNRELKDGACVLFDDCIFSDDKINKSIQKLIDMVLQLGRSAGVYCVIVSHVLNEGKKTKVTWTEVHGVCMFPKSGNRYQMEYALKNYVGLGKKDIDKILNLKSRWVFVGKKISHVYRT